MKIRVSDSDACDDPIQPYLKNLSVLSYHLIYAKYYSAWINTQMTKTKLQNFMCGRVFLSATVVSILEFYEL